MKQLQNHSHTCNRFFSAAGIWTLAFGHCLYGRLFLATAGLLVMYIFIADVFYVYRRICRFRKDVIYQAIWAENASFDQILVSPAMFLDHMPTVMFSALKMVRYYPACLFIHCVSKKNRTPITFWNNSNKLCLIIIMISWENRQKVLNIVVCYGLTIFHKTAYQLRLNWSSAWWRSGLAYGRPLSMTQSTNGEDVSGPVFE